MTMGLNIVLLGVIVSIIFFEITDISPGGIIVPGLMVLYIQEPERMVYTVIVAVITYYIVKLLSKYLIIFGKRRFVVMIFVSILINFFLDMLLKMTSFNMINISIIGYTIAGLIANDFHKQGLKRTIPALFICVAIIELISIILLQIGV
jgi:poly-gamma-glutamate biosynthesis protein PgsC/CapC